MANTYTLRVDAVEGITRDKIISFCKSVGFVDHVVVHEISSETQKPHYQGYVTTDIKHQAYQKRVIKAFPEVVATGCRGGRGMYSAGVVKDADSYHRYLMKGTPSSPPDVVTSSIQLNLDELWKASQTAEEAKKRRDTSKIDKTKHIVQRGIDHFKMVEWPRHYDERRKQSEVFYWVANDMRDAGKLHDDFLVIKYINSILIGVSPESLSYIHDRVLNRL